MVTKPQLSHFFEIDITEYIETVKLRRNTKTFKQNDNNIVTIFATQPWQFFNNKKTKFWVGFPSKISKACGHPAPRPLPGANIPLCRPRHLVAPPPPLTPWTSPVFLRHRPLCPLPSASALGLAVLCRSPPTTPPPPPSQAATSPSAVCLRLVAPLPPPLWVLPPFYHDFTLVKFSPRDNHGRGQ